MSEANKGDLIVFENIRYCYGAVCALGGVCAAIREKKLTALIGPNGGGKSTFIKLMAGLLKPDEGRIVYHKDSHVGYVPQNMGFDVTFPVTVCDMVLMGTLDARIRPMHRYSRADRQAADDAIRRVGLEEVAARCIDQLSGGQQRRAIIARAIASNADVIVLDEPDSSLDVDAAGVLFEMLAALKADKTLVVASHNVAAILGIADAAIYINATAQVYDDPHRLRDVLKGGVVL